MTADTIIKLERLRGELARYGSCVVAYSGGVDSVFLANVAHDVLGDRALAVIADSPSLPRRELEEAVATARALRFPLHIVRTKEFQNPNYMANPLNRCYYCKHTLFEELADITRAGGFAVIAYGENASDSLDVRPGSAAAREFQVKAPLREVGLTKAEIRELSARLGLPTADKPQMACLSSRIPHGEPVSTEKLRMVEKAETVLRELGFYDVRVRHHELGPVARQVMEPALVPVESAAALARIQVGPTELAKLLADDIRTRVVKSLKDIGYVHVTVDLVGYHRPA